MTATERVVVKELSSSLLDMKFMIKKKKQVEAKEAKRRESKLDQSIGEGGSEATCSTERTQARDEVCYDYAKLENLLFGRLSFNGFNKDVESLMEYYERKRNGEVSDEEDEGKDVDDQEMAESFGAQKLEALSKKNQSKRERRQQNEKNDESTGGRKFNFKDIRKRFNDGELTDGEPERKFLRPADD